jgi:hypothetical protein
MAEGGDRTSCSHGGGRMGSGGDRGEAERGGGVDKVRDGWG